MLTVAVCTYNRLNDLKLFLLSVKRSGLPDGVELMVVDNSSDSLTRSFFKTYSELPVSYINIPPQGLSAARNKAVEQCQTEYLLFLDDDCLVPKHFFHPILAALKEGDTDLFTGPVEGLLPYDKIPCVPAEAIVQPNHANQIDPPGNYLGVRTAFAKQVGPFRTDLGKNKQFMGYGEDTDFVNRARHLKASFKWINGDCIIHQSLQINLTEWFGVWCGHTLSSRQLNSNQESLRDRLRLIITSFWTLLSQTFKYLIVSDCKRKYDLFRSAGSFYGLGIFYFKK